MQTTSEHQAARVEIESGFAWDEQDAYLFDIDGTLVRDINRIHMSSFAPSIRRVTGLDVSLEGVPVQGSTDTAILRDAFRMNAVPKAVFEPRMEAILEAMRENVARRRHEFNLLVMPGVEETLRHLTDKGAVLGVATGNLEEIGWIKLEEAGLRSWFRFGGFSDQFSVRSEMVGDAARIAREIAGADARICVVGDTLRDIEAAHANSLPVIAVATHHYSFDALLEHRPEVCATSLADLLAHTRVVL
jgi:phosphoglycolate phosphatase-like HAD superfamily hydrolase